jgi:hypothetical protein
VYPTIASEYFIVDFENYTGESKNFEINLFNASGQIMQNHTLGIQDHKVVKVTFKEDLSAGLYFVTIFNGNERISKVLLLQ